MFWPKSFTSENLVTFGVGGSVLEETNEIDDEVIQSKTTSQLKKTPKSQPRSLSEYQSEYAKSGRSLCNKCKEKIAKDHLRFGINVDHDEVNTFFLDKILSNI